MVSPRRRAMPRTYSPQVRALGIGLQKARRAAGQSLRAIEQQSGISRSALQRLEAGQALPQLEDLGRILGAIGVQDPLFQELIDLAEAARHPNWLASGADLPWQLQTLIDYEQIAIGITSVSLGAIPGLLQTEDYARELFALTGVTADELKGRLSARMDRQAILSRTSLAFEAIVDELALERPVASRGVIVRQLQHLVHMGNQATIRVQIVPHDRPVLAARNASYDMMTFEQLPPVVQMEFPGGGMFLDQPEAVDRVRLTTDMIRQSALSPAESTGLIQRMIRRLESR